MRSKTALQELFSYDTSSSVKVVREYVKKYESLDELLRLNPKILKAAHVDLAQVLSESKTGRDGGYTSEQIFRSLMVMFIERWTYRQTVIQIDTSDVLQQFVRLGWKPMMDFTFLSKAFGALSEPTWEIINQKLSQYAKENEMISGEKLRMDTTVYETNIHYPTDSSLLWDGYRTVARLLKNLREEMRAVGLCHRFHIKKVKKLMYFIARNGKSKSKRTQQKVKRAYRNLLERVAWIVEIARCVFAKLFDPLLPELDELKHYCPLVKKVMDQTERRVFQGEKVPADEKLYSIFEEHTELIIRGKAGKPVEFGHKYLVAQSEEKFITHYQTMETQQADTALLEPALQAHRDLFGDLPDVLAADKGFYESREKLAELTEKIETVAIGKKGRRTQEETERETSEEFKEGQRFRAGSEGSISVLKRAYKLKKCLFKGFKNFAVSVGCAVFCHNLVLLTKL